VFAHVFDFADWKIGVEVFDHPNLVREKIHTDHFVAAVSLGFFLIDIPGIFPFSVVIQKL
jgi:hypothetical protein